MTCPKPHCEVGRWGEWPLGPARDGVLGPELFEKNFLPQHGISTSQRPRRQPKGKVLQLSRDPSLGPRTSHPSNARSSASRSRRLSRTIDWFSPPGVARARIGSALETRKRPGMGRAGGGRSRGSRARRSPSTDVCRRYSKPKCGVLSRGRGGPLPPHCLWF